MLWHLRRHTASFAGKIVELGIDNMTCIRWLLRWTARPPQALNMVKLIWHLCSKNNIELRPVYVPTEQNDCADALSRGNTVAYNEALARWLVQRGGLSAAEGCAGGG